MKRSICILISILMLVAAAGCNQQKAEVSFEDMMAFENIELVNDDYQYSYDTLQGFISHFESKDKNFAFATVSVKEVTHYLTWDQEDGVFGGYTLTQVCIDSIDEQYNDFAFDVGDTVIIRQSYYILPANRESRFAFAAEKTNTRIDTPEDMANIEDFTAKLELSKNEEYEKVIFERQMPLKKGETYSMAICAPPPEMEIDCYYGYHIAPISMCESIEYLEDTYGLIFCDVYKTVANEIKKLLVK